MRLVGLGNENEIGVTVPVEIGGANMLIVVTSGTESAFVPAKFPFAVIQVQPVRSIFHGDRGVEITVTVHVRKCSLERVQRRSLRHMRDRDVVESFRGTLEHRHVLCRRGDREDR